MTSMLAWKTCGAYHPAKHASGLRTMIKVSQCFQVYHNDMCSCTGLRPISHSGQKTYLSELAVARIMPKQLYSSFTLPTDSNSSSNVELALFAEHLSDQTARRKVYGR